MTPVGPAEPIGTGRGGSSARLSDLALLDAWGRGRGLSMPGRASVLLRASGDHTRGDPDAWPIGLRDARLLDAREATFGSSVEGTCPCPACGIELDVSFDIEQIRLPAAEETAALEIEVPPWRVRFRPPTNGDLGAVRSEGGPEEARRLLAERCVIRAERMGKREPAAALPDAVVAEMALAVAKADPQAEVRFSMQCPDCGARWDVPFDVASFLWEEVDARARRVLVDVHTLAAAYGWAESDILALPEERRRGYLELVLG